MTTPQPGGFDASTAGGSRLLGGANSLQEALDNLTTAVRNNTQAVQQAAGGAPGGTPTAVGSTGQSITYGSFPRMSPAMAGFSAMNNPQSTLGQAAGSMAGMAQSALSPSSSAFSNQITMNQYAAMSTLGMSPGTSMGAGMAAMYNQAFGRYGSNLNAIAQNPGDAAQMYSNLQGIAGSPYVMSTALGQAGYGATAGFGYANPALGGAGASAAAAQLYSGQTSLAMRSLGYSATPRAGMGQQSTTQMGQTIQSMLQRWYGSGTVSQNTLNAGLANNGKVQLNLQALGLNPQTMGPALQMYNKLFQQGVSASQANTMLSDAAHNANYGNQGSAQKLLSGKYGIATSDLQKLKDTTAVGTSTTAGEMGGFDSALSAATTTVQKFDTVMSKILGDTGLGNLLGASHGFNGVMSSVGGAFGGLLGKLGGVGMGMLSRLGGAAGTPASSGSSGQGNPSSTTSRPSGAAATAIKDAESQLGKPYQWGGDNPTTGFDCSGLIEWAYAQAGIRLPRTSQEQWAYLQHKSVPTNKVMAGDIVFSAGSDGTAAAPGHEAMMISNNAIIESPYTGADIRIRSYNPGEWQHAGRPTGNLNASGGGSYGGGTSGTNGMGLASTTVGQGNGGLGLAVGNYGSSSELDNVASSLMGGSMTGGGGFSTMGSTSVGNGQGSGATTTSTGPTTMGGQQAEAIAKKLAAAYGWGSGTQWNDLVQLWMDESGWRVNAQNASGAYGIPQALPGDKMASAGADWRTSASTQIKWGLGYIKNRWGNPAAALANENAVHWYADGTGSARGGLAIVGERGPELVSLSGGQQVVNAGKTANILKGTQAQPQQAGSVATINSLYLAAQPQNYGQGAFAGKAEVNLNMPPGAIVVHATGSASDVSHNVRTIMQGITESMADNEMIQKIMAGVMG